MSAIEQLAEDVAPAMAGERLDRFVAMLGDLSRSEATTLVKAGAVTVDGAVVTKPSLRVEAGAAVAVTVERREHELDAEPDLEVPIVHVDEAVIVVDKPAGLVVHPGAGQRSGTVVNGLLARFPEIAGVGGDPDRPGVVHRLDKGTSGVMMFARTEEAHLDLTGQLAARTVDRRYLTLAWGAPEANEGLIDAPLGRSPRDATRQAVVAGGREARTHYTVAHRVDGGVAALLWCRLETGRTHQIRVHLEAIGHPVVGDDRYGGRRRRDADLPSALYDLDRPFLHAAHLGFRHPVSGDHLAFDSPLPAELSAVASALSIDLDA